MRRTSALHLRAKSVAILVNCQIPVDLLLTEAAVANELIRYNWRRFEESNYAESTISVDHVMEALALSPNSKYRRAITLQLCNQNPSVGIRIF